MTDAAFTEPRVLRILSDILEVPADELSAKRTLAAHPWDSLSSLEVLYELESQFGIRLDLRAFNASRTVGDLVALVSSAAGKASAA